MKAENNQLTKNEIQSKLEYYCAYQERCYKEVEEKLYSFAANSAEKEEILTYLIENNFINEERFAQSFVRGKHNYKLWGKNRIINELKYRNISSKIIEIALKEISETVYLSNFHALAENYIGESKAAEIMNMPMTQLLQLRQMNARVEQLHAGLHQ